MDPSEWQSVQEEVTAYMAGDLSPEQAAEFEKRLRNDESLRREVKGAQEAFAALKDWMDTDAPGVERVESLPVPRVARPAAPSPAVLRLPERRPILALWRWVAVAAVFVAGFVIGQMTPPQPSVGGGERVILPPPLQTTQPGQPGTQGPQPSPEAPTRLAERPEQGESVRPATVEPARYSSEENGRLVIETTLRNTGARALWVVDGAFDLTPSKGGSPS